MTTSSTGTQLTALPGFYYFCFAIYEPLLTFAGLLETFSDPVQRHNTQAPWPNNIEPITLPKATLVSIFQLAHVCAVVGLVNLFVLTIARKHLHSQPALQEKIVWGLFTPLLIGDVAHIVITLWALEDEAWNVANWTPMLWATILIGLSLMIPRICWYVGIGRYVDMRDGAFKKYPPGEVKQQ